MIVKQIQLSHYPYKTRQGLSEKVVKNYFEKKGYVVFRGSLLYGKELSVNYYRYEAVQKKYDLFEDILKKKIGPRLEEVQDRARRQSGVPDYFLYKKSLPHPEMFFAEVKLEHEQVRPNQYRFMKYLEDLGFNVQILRVAKKLFRMENSLEVNISNKGPVIEKKLTTKQMRLTKKFEKRKRTPRK